jgi:hypothetical protein
MRRTTHLCGPSKSAPTPPACHCSARCDSGTGFVIATRLRGTAAPREGPARRARADSVIDVVAGRATTWTRSAQRASATGWHDTKVVRQRLGRSTRDGRDHPRHLQPRPAVRRPGRCPDPGERHPRIERDHAGAAATRVGNALPRRARANPCPQFRRTSHCPRRRGSTPRGGGSLPSPSATEHAAELRKHTSVIPLRGRASRTLLRRPLSKRCHERSSSGALPFAGIGDAAPRRGLSGSPAPAGISPGGAVSSLLSSP